MGCLVISTVAFASSFVVFTFLADLIVDLYGNASVAIPLVLLVTGAAGATGNNLSGRFTDKLGAVAALRLAMIGTTAGLGLFATSSLLHGVAAGTVAAPGLVLWSLAAWGHGPPQQAQLLALAPDAPDRSTGGERVR